MPRPAEPSPRPEARSLVSAAGLHTLGSSAMSGVLKTGSRASARVAKLSQPSPGLLAWLHHGLQRPVTSSSAGV